MMHRPHLCTLALFLLLLCAGLTACEKLELPTDKEKEETDKGGDKDTGKDNGGGTVDPGAILRVSELKSDDVPVGEEVWVKGYIVGYVPKNKTMSGTVFSAEGAVETNLVLADSPDETAHAACAPMQLKANSEVRLDLNLADYPDNLGRLVYLYGIKTTYYKSIGLKPVIDYNWENPDGETEDDGGGNKDPEKPSDPSASDPVINYDAPATVMEGD